VGYWDSLLSMDLFENKDVVLGEDFNLSLGSSEVWGPRTVPDPLANFFIQAFARKDLLDIIPTKLSPTWRNKRAGEQRVAKRLDRFLVAEVLALGVDVARQWVGSGGVSDHCPIFLEMRGRRRKPPSPFKFNHIWLKEESFQKLVQDLWVHRPQKSMEFAGSHFHQNLKRIKQTTLTWAHEKRIKEDQTLCDCERAIEHLLNNPGLGYLDNQSKEELLSLEKKRNEILCDREATCRMKSRAIWLQCGDENTKFFQAYAKGRKFTNTLWELKSTKGEMVTSFDGLDELGVQHFEDLFREQPGASIVEVIRVA